MFFMDFGAALDGDFTDPSVLDQHEIVNVHSQVEKSRKGDTDRSGLCFRCRVTAGVFPTEK